MHVCRAKALLVGQHLRVHAQLHDVAGPGRLGELGIKHLVAVFSQRRGALALHQEIRIATPGLVQKGPLVDDVGTGLHGKGREFCTCFKAAFCGNHMNFVSLILELLQVGPFMFDAPLSQELLGGTGFFSGHGVGQVAHVQETGMRALQEGDQVGGRVEKLTWGEPLHGAYSSE